MRVVVLIAVGDTKWAEMALNMCLAIKANDSNQKVVLLYSEGCIKGLEPLIDKYFDAGLNIFNHLESYIEFAFYLKTRMYDYVIQMLPDADTFIYLDSDCILIPGQSVSQWFDKHEGREFAIYSNDVYDYETGKRKRKDYTFWCNIDEVKEKFPEIKQIPQTNSSFIYFRKGETAKILFDKVKEMWDDTTIKFQDYKKAKPDEFCFNVACAVTGIMPHQTHYRPIFFSFASETQNSEYILHYYKAFGFAGIQPPRIWMVDMYNSIARYYRNHFSIVRQFECKIESVMVTDPNPVDIRIVNKRTLYRRDEIENSAGGIFNPSGVVLPDGSIMTMYRKEAIRDVVAGYIHNSAIPHVHILSANSEVDYEIEMPQKDPHIRYEDFKLFQWDSTVMVAHHKIIGNLKDGMTCEPVISVLRDKELLTTQSIPLPVQKNKIEKNWVYIADDEGFYTIYSLSPYRIFKGIKEPQELMTKTSVTGWFHNSFISNSTNPVLIGDHYLLFFHSKQSGYYFHGAALLDKHTKEITHYTRNSIPVKSHAEGFQPTIIYVSGCAYLKDRNLIRLFFGEADSHSCYNDYDATEFMNMLKLFPIEQSDNNEGALERLKQSE